MGTSPTVTPLCFGKCPVFPSGAPTSAWRCSSTLGTWRMHLLPEHLGVGSCFRGFDAFFFCSPGEEKNAPGDAPGVRLVPGHPSPRFLLCFSRTARSLLFLEDGNAKLCTPRRRHSGKHQPVPRLRGRVIWFHCKTILLPDAEQVWSSPREVQGSASH